MVGERVGVQAPCLGEVYKLMALESGGVISPRIKVSSSPDKTTYPSVKMPYRLINKATKKAFADLIVLEDEGAPAGDYELFDPLDTTKITKIYEGEYEALPLLAPVYSRGKLVYDYKTPTEIKEYVKTQIQLLPKSVTRLYNPQKYYVDISKKLYDLQTELKLAIRT
jgi:nicotinate phosphoribosyltransferase